MTTINLLVVGSQILHAGIPVETDVDLIYPDIIYPKHIIGPNWEVVELDVPDWNEFFNIYLYTYDKVTNTLVVIPTEAPTEPPTEPPTEEPQQV